MSFRAPLKNRLMRRVKIDAASGCWLWLGAKDRDGYGQVRGEGFPWVMLKAHRASYELHCQEIPPGLVLDHLCRNTSCVNPKHLEPVTNQVNMARAASLLTHCKQGHSWSPENTGIRSNGKRYCRICNRSHYTRWHGELKASGFRRGQYGIEPIAGQT